MARAGFILALSAALAVVLVPVATWADRSDFVGAKACAKCHQAQYNAWAKTAHARATATLGKRTRRACLGCHSTGDAPAGRAYFSGVQCEACHGAGAGYHADDVMRDPTLSRQLGLRDLSTPQKRAALCNACHVAQTRLKPFDAAAAYQKIKH